MASKRIRDFKKEYQARIARGLAKGKSRAQSRGHARANDLPSGTAGTIDAESPLEKALKLMKQGMSQKQAAKAVGVSAEKLRRYQKQNTTSVRQGRRWVISDSRPVSMVMATRGKLKTVTLPRDAGGDIGRHWVAINKFLETNDPSHLKPFVGRGLRDNQSLLHPFETRPNILRKLDSVGELSFVDIYRQTVQ
ncbi:hypothetical protein [Microvirga antarctica]|uniref:hypothetical protein n=1 Tax=Microvirga antarctica TaxID=2819233 RepID=UPI001B3136F3|nr:hypothetical protein [Microvirga antarctica]